jgi:hypothetical protein
MSEIAYWAIGAVICSIWKLIAVLDEYLGGLASMDAWLMMYDCPTWPFYVYVNDGTGLLLIQIAPEAA